MNTEQTSKNIFTYVRIIGVSGLWSFVYFINFQKGKFQPQTNIVLENKNPLSIKPSSVVWSIFLKKKTSVFSVWNLFTVFEVIFYGHLVLPGVFPGKLTSVIDVTTDAVVQCEVPVVRILF